MASSTKKYSSDFKVKVALKAIKGQKTIKEMSSRIKCILRTSLDGRSKGWMNCHRSLHVQALSEPRVSPGARLCLHVKYEESYIKDY